MNNTLSFHERCNGDIDRFVNTFKLLNIDIAKLKLQLIFAYQLIFENPNVGSSYIAEENTSLTFRDGIKYYELQNMDCFIIYKYVPPMQVIVLGIFRKQRSWRV